MACFINFLLVTIVVGSSVRVVWGNSAVVQAGDNAEQFALLCLIYNVAKNPPINHVDLLDPNKIVNEIDVLNASFTEEKQFNETEQMGKSSDSQAKPTNSREAAVAQAMLKRITKKAHTILEEIRNVNATRNIEKVKTEFAQVIFSEVGNESNLCHGALKDVTDRGTACGKPGLSSKGDSAGKNLVVDFFCLCAQNTNNKDGIDNVCGFFMGRKGAISDKHGWEETRLLGSSAMWASVKKGCRNLLHQNTNSIEEGRELLKDFLKHLKSGGLYRWEGTSKVQGSERKAGMLGTSVSNKDASREKNPVCDGKKGGKTGNPGGMCVYYGSKSEWDNIYWMRKYKTALDTAEAINNQTTTIQRNIEKLQTLLHRAEEIYETAKVISVIQNPVDPTNLQTAAKRLTAYNSAWKHGQCHFIVTLVILLL